MLPATQPQCAFVCVFFFCFFFFVGGFKATRPCRKVCVEIGEQHPGKECMAPFLKNLFVLFDPPLVIFCFKNAKGSFSNKIPPALKFNVRKKKRTLAFFIP